MKKILMIIFLFVSLCLYGHSQIENTFEIPPEIKEIIKKARLTITPGVNDIYPTTGDIIPGKEKQLVKFKQKYSDVSMESLEDTVIAMVQRYMPYTDFVHHKSSIIDSLQMRDFTQIDIRFISETYYTENADSVVVKLFDYLWRNVGRGIDCHYRIKKDEFEIYYGFYGRIYEVLSRKLESKITIRKEADFIEGAMRVTVRDSCLESIEGTVLY